MGTTAYHSVQVNDNTRDNGKHTNIQMNQMEKVASLEQDDEHKTDDTTQPVMDKTDDTTQPDIHDISIRIAPDEIIPDNLQNQKKQSLTTQFGNISNNLFSLISFILMSILSFIMVFAIYTSYGNDYLWNQQTIIFIISLIIIPLFFMFTKMNVIIIHNRFYADYIHCVLIFILIMFFFSVSTIIIMQNGDNNDISSQHMSILLLTSYSITHFFIFNLTSRLWILMLLQKYALLLSLWILCLIAFTFSVIIMFYWNE
eukprot:235085_1